MIAFMARRFVQAALVMLIVAFLAFLMFQHVGDPVLFILGQDATPQQIAQLRADLRLDRSVAIQYLHFIANAVQGEFGLSLRQGARVSRLMVERLPATLELAAVAASMALAVGIALGVYCAIFPRSISSRIAMAVSLVGVSLPSFLVGMILILVFAVQLGWMPSFGRGETATLGPWTTGLLNPAGWKHLILPALTLALFQVALITRLVRAEMLEVLRADFIRFAHARGLSQFRIHLRHALRNALLPVITVTGLQLGGLIAFALVTETVFQWPGLGLLFVESVVFADIPVMAAYLCLVSLIFVAINLIVDLLYFAVDPRLHPARVGSAP